MECVDEDAFTYVMCGSRYIHTLTGRGAHTPPTTHTSHNTQSFGWEVPDGIGHNWDTMVNNIQDYVASLNFRYRTDLRSNKVSTLTSLRCSLCVLL